MTPAASHTVAPPLLAPVLYYHLISPPPQGSARPSIYLEPQRFARQMRLLRWMGYRSMTLDEMLDALDSGVPLPPKRVLISFDDGHLDNFTTAGPILMEHGFRATIFVVAGAIGGRLKLRASVDPAGEPLMDAAQLRQMAADGFEIQSHGMTHANLAQLGDDEAQQEIATSRAVLEDIVQRPVRYFSYPYGSFRPAHLRMVEQAGYRGAFSTVHGRRHTFSERYCLKRIPIHHERSLAGFINMLCLRPFGRAQQQLDRLRTRGET